MVNSAILKETNVFKINGFVVNSSKVNGNKANVFVNDQKEINRENIVNFKVLNHVYVVDLININYFVENIKIVELTIFKENFIVKVDINVVNQNRVGLNEVKKDKNTDFSVDFGYNNFYFDIFENMV